MIYDSGSMITCINSKIFRKIPISKRPAKLPNEVKPICASGDPLRVTGCYLLPFKLNGRNVKHPVYVCQNLKTSGLIGYDLASRIGLNLDARSGEVFYDSPEGPHYARLSKETYIPAGSKTVATVHSDLEGHQLLDISISKCPQIISNNVLISAKEKCAKIELFNASDTPIRLPRGETVGHVMMVTDEELLPWHPEEELSVSHTTPLGTNDCKQRKVQLTQERKKKILEKANLHHLPPLLKAKYITTLYDFHDTLSLDEFELSKCSKGKHSIPLYDEGKAVYQPQFPLSFVHKQEIERQVKAWYKLGLIRKCESEWNSPLFVVKKKSLDSNSAARWRVVQDLRTLNLHTKPSNTRIPLLSDCMDRIALRKPTIFSSFDLKSGFYQVELSGKDQHKTAFEIPGQGQFCFKVAAQGLAYMPSSFQRIMERCFRKLIASNCLTVYLDDLLTYATSHDEMLEIIRQILTILRSSGLLLHLEKCSFGLPKLTYLGYEIDSYGFRPDPAKTEAITKCPPPTTLKGIRAFLGMLQFFRAHFPRFSETIKPLSKLTGHKAGWSGGTLPPDALKAFNKCKELISERPALSYADFNLDFYLYCDGSLGEVEKLDSGGLSAVLVQFPKNDQTKPPRILGFANRTLSESERNYSAFLIENAAAVFGVEQFSKYLLGTKFYLVTDHRPMVKLNGTQKRTLERLREILANYTFEFLHIKGENNPSDYLSRHVNKSPIQKKVLVNAVEIDPNSNSLLSSMNASMLKTQQSDDPFISSLKHFIFTKELPEKQPTRGIVKRFGPTCFVENGLVYRHLTRPGMPDRNVLVAPGHIHAAIISEAHGSIYSGHLGEYKTAERILESYWWPSIFHDASAFVASCPICIRNLPKNAQSCTFLKPYEQSQIFERIHVDLFGPLLTDEGKKFVLVAICSASKYAIFVPLANKEPVQVAKALFDNWFTKFGIPRILVNDSGSEFKNKLLKSMCDLLKIDQRFIAVQRPSSNGQVENVNRILAKYLKSFSQERPLDWERHLTALQWSYNTSVHKATKISPFSFLYGVDARTPITDLAALNTKYYGDDYQYQLLKRLQTARKIAMENNMQYKAAYKAAFDEKVKPQNWQSGMLVWLHMPESCKINKKIVSPFSGPFVILEIVNEHSVVVQNLQTRKTKVVNCNRLRRYAVQNDDLKLNKAKAAESSDKESRLGPAEEAASAKMLNSDNMHEKERDFRPGNSRPNGPTFIEFDEPEIVVLKEPQQPVLPIPIKIEENPDEIVTLESTPIRDEGTNIDTSNIQAQQHPTPINVPQSRNKIAQKLQIGVQKFAKTFSPEKMPTASEVGAQIAGPFTRRTAAKLDVVVPDAPLPSRPLEYRPHVRRGGKH